MQMHYFIALHLQHRASFVPPWLLRHVRRQSRRVHWLHRLSQPTLIMARADDPLVPILNAHILKTMNPHSEPKVFQPRAPVPADTYPCG